ncbi:MAG: hypothetical protein FWE01_02225 [Firmicutes bacterium]|nr:hypothetical protein [Bacillota bacterium]
MTMARRVTIYGIFFLILVVFVIVCLFLFQMWFPDGFNIFNFGRANRNSFTRYYGSDIEAILRHRNIMIDAKNTDIDIWVRKPGHGYGGPELPSLPPQNSTNTMTIREDARNNRSWLEWTQVFVDDELFFRIVVNEGSTAFNRRPLLEINLCELDFDVDDADFRPYNFIFNLGAGSVRFLFAYDVLQTFAEEGIETTRFGRIEIGEGASGTYTIPSPRALGGGTSFTVEVNQVIVNNSDIVINAARVPVRERLDINTQNGRFVFGNVGISGTGSSVEINNGQNVVLTTDDIFGFLDVNTTMGGVNAGIIMGDVRMSTFSGSLDANQIMGDLYFSTSFMGRATVNQVRGRLDFISSAGGTLNITRLYGVADVDVDNATITIGALSTTGEGAHNNVTVRNNYGNTIVRFATVDQVLASAPFVYILGRTGNITVNNIVGQAVIRLQPQIGSIGDGHIFANFRRVVSTAVAGGNLLENLGRGNINVILNTTNNGLAPFIPFWLRVESSEQARDRTGWTVHGIAGNTNLGRVIPNFNAPHPSGGQMWPVHPLDQNPTDANRVLVVRTSNAVDMRLV